MSILIALRRAPLRPISCREQPRSSAAMAGGARIGSTAPASPTPAIRRLLTTRTPRTARCSFSFVSVGAVREHRQFSPAQLTRPGKLFDGRIKETHRKLQERTFTAQSDGLPLRPSWHATGRALMPGTNRHSL